MAMHNPPPPGGIVKRQCLEPLGLTVTRAAEGLGVTRQALSELVNGDRGGALCGGVTSLSALWEHRRRRKAGGHRGRLDSSRLSLEGLSFPGSFVPLSGIAATRLSKRPSVPETPPNKNMPLTPEQLARKEIDVQLEACGWVIQDFASMNIHAWRGVAVREYPLKWREGAEIRSGSADYLLYANGRAIGVIEAKPAGHTLKGVVVQSKRYVDEQGGVGSRGAPYILSGPSAPRSATTEKHTNPVPAAENYFTNLGRVCASGVATGELSSYGPLANLLDAVGAALKPEIFHVAELADLSSVDWFPEAIGKLKIVTVLGRGKK